MNRQERAMLVWSVFFVVSGVVFMMAFMFSPVVGTLVTTAYILMYLGLSAVFVMVFRELSTIRKETVDTLVERKEELEEVENALKSKYFKKKIDDSSYRKMVQDYEKTITELEVKIKRLGRDK
jgi:membrane protein implicated in regulation of membrane protease activity